MTEEVTAPAEPSPISEAQEAPEPPQAPQEPEAPKEPVFRSRREALEKAFEEVDKPAKEPAKQEAEVKPEEGRPRNPDGTFAAKEKASEAPKAPEAEQKPQEPKSPIGEPPARFSADAKAAWKDAPESVRGEIGRAITELENGLRQKDETLTPLRPFMDMAKQHGTTVHDALGNYVRMEQAWRSDPAKGFDLLAQNFGMTSEDLLARVQGKQRQPDAKDRQIEALIGEINALKTQVGGITQNVTQTQEAALVREIEAFAADHPRFDELEPEMARMISTGYAADLADAYEKAERLNPAPAAPPPPPQPVQPRQPQSVTGAPSAGSNPGNRQPSKTRTEALNRAFGAVGL